MSKNPVGNPETSSVGWQRSVTRSVSIYSHSRSIAGAEKSVAQ
ncbi:hypothetical protein [Streptomyces sp. NPDC055036]